MIKKTILLGLFISTTAGSLGYAQVKIGNNPETVHPRAVLHVEHSTKGIMLPVVENHTELPNYNAAHPDLYENKPEDNGLVFYSKELKDVVKYDGYRWISATERSIKNYKNLSILGSSAADQSVANVLGITGRPTLLFNILNDIDRNNVNNLGVTVNANGEITIPADGFYRINPSVKTSSAGGLSVGNAATIVSLQALYVNASGDGWQKIHENSFLLSGLLVTAGSANSVNSFSITKYLHAGDQIRLRGGIQADTGLNVGTGVNFKMNDKDTFLYIEKLN
ncbi:hypothetical protein P2W68_17810 [Chryseobacterium arthrosphaerae]|uniref:hypothetical protein n=1 Tax=Chryseobacterium arthrosphaerae TaxID=651561 RepID=UPI0023E08F30|nr:hypothetical protein [Chryseobacterium arthrosphaerae]WES96692.1 hypothetical protein P2W68_17810 [Chryseobacterium arthrosphaerae]